MVLSYADTTAAFLYVRVAQEITAVTSMQPNTILMNQKFFILKWCIIHAIDKCYQCKVARLFSHFNF